jgi:hypothetical protein
MIHGIEGYIASESMDVIAACWLGHVSKVLSWFFRCWNVGGALCPDGMPATSAVGA